MYLNADLIRIARRNYDGARRFVVVNPLQGKHVPVSPSKAIAMMGDLGRAVKNAFPDEKFLCIGFAETASAIGVVVAGILDAPYLHTTREHIVGVKDYFFFQETHSRWAEQKLCADGWKDLCKGVTRIVLVDDEISTGKTIRALVALLRKNKEIDGDMRFTVASIINTLDSDYERYLQEESIDAAYLLKASNSSFDAETESITLVMDIPHSDGMELDVRPHFVEYGGKVEPRRGVDIKTYIAACDLLAEKIIGDVENIRSMKTKTALFLGTEEFMFPAIKAASVFEKRYPEIDVKCHATTSSPIAPSKKDGYPIQNAHGIRSFYAEDRGTFVYNLMEYDLAVVVTDTEFNDGQLKNSVDSICGALAANNITNIFIAKWGR